jgi:ABC-type sulfate/molybdate transport systems ATPase subunit
VATLSVELALPLRTFALELALEVAGTVALVGPSGAGKTSALRAIAGLARPSAGRIALGDEVWFDSSRRVCRPPDERHVGLVFQEYALFPHLTVRQNVAYGGRERAGELLERFGIAGLADARTTELSGGERQRVALARALAREPGVLLLDEPLAALDAHTKSGVRAELRELLRELRLPTLLVTHDYEDAASLADEIGVIVDGKLRQLGTPQQLVAKPADAFVASFTGANLLRGRAERRHGVTVVRLETGEEIRSTDPLEGEVGVAVYPWQISLSVGEPEPGANAVRGEVRSIVQSGNRSRVQIGPLTAEVDELREPLLLGARVAAAFAPADTRLVPIRP